MVRLNNENFENSLGVNIKGNNTFLVARDGEVIVFDDLSYEEMDRINLNIGESDTREPLEILSFNVSHDYEFVAVFIGKQLIKDEEQLLVLSILKLDTGSSTIEHVLNIDLVKHNMSSYCKQLYFDIMDSGKLILVSGDKIVKFDFGRERIEDFYDFQTDFDDQPEFFVFNKTQTTCIIGTPSDTLFIDLKEKKEIDLDSLYGIGDIKNVYFYEGFFYILANKRKGLLGYYLARMDQNDPMKYKKNENKLYIINASNRLDIGDSSITLLYQNSKKLVIVSYKSILVNTFRIFVIDSKNGSILSIHESFCLWESKIMAFMNTTTFDYILLS